MTGRDSRNATRTRKRKEIVTELYALMERLVAPDPRLSEAEREEMRKRYDALLRRAQRLPPS